jgi:serine phosphatase RsbU (regulator of sigma subunit)
MHKIVRYLFLALLLLTTGGIPLTAEETLPPKLQTLADEAYHSYSARETENFFEAIQNVKEATEQGMFVTMFIGLIDLKTGHMAYCNAGHNPPLLDGEFMKMESNAPIGLWPKLEYAGEEVGDMHGKTLFVYTDGINEAENVHKEQFGDERLRALLKNDLGNARQTSEAIHKAVEEFVGEAEPSDDLTKMCIKMN